MVVLKIALIAVGASVYILCGIGWDIWCNIKAEEKPNVFDTVIILVWPVCVATFVVVCILSLALRLVSAGIRKFTERR